MTLGDGVVSMKAFGVDDSYVEFADTG